MTGCATTWEIVSDEPRFRSLEAEWDALWQRTSDRRLSHTFNWFRAGWETTGRPRGRRLCVVVMRRNGEVVLIWPMVRRRRCVLWTEAVAMGGEFTEYDPILVADGAEAAADVSAAWAWMRARRIADVIEVPFVREDSAAHGVLAGDTTQRYIETYPAPYIAWDGFKTWDAYWQSRSKNLKGNLGRKGRRLAELGELTFELIDDHAEYVRLLDWSIAIKLDWMAHTGLANSFMHTPEFRALLTALHASPTPQGQWSMFALKLDGRVLATKMGALDATRFEGFIAAQDPEFGNYSIGSVILIKALEWLHARQLSYDFRFGDEAYKLDWATGDCPTVKYRFAVNPMGVAFLAIDRWIEQIRVTKDTVRTSIPKDVRSRFKAWLRTPLTAAGLRSVKAG